jgi:hypothetical protein
MHTVPRRPRYRVIEWQDDQSSDSRTEESRVDDGHTDWEMSNAIGY